MDYGSLHAAVKLAQFLLISEFILNGTTALSIYLSDHTEERTVLAYMHASMSIYGILANR